MNKQFTWKFAVMAAVALTCFFSMWPPREKIQLGLDLKGGTSYLLKMDLSQIDQAGKGSAIKQAIDILGRRVDKFGVTEPIIQSVGEDRILVQIPGLKEDDRQAARSLIEKTAYLEFLLVHADNDKLQADSSSPYFRPPLGYTNLTETSTREGRTVTRSYYCKIRPEQGLTGKYIERAYVSYDDIGRPYISMQFNKEGATIFGKVTGASVGRQLAIVLDGELQSAPVIQDAILGGNAQITGSFSITEAQRLASVLENPLQAPVKVLEERGVDPSLGRDSIKSGVRAALIGAIGVVVFMAIYYLAAGIVADFALALNILILVGVLAMFKFTLTLPGIAGIVLTIGMAVDANVLIYERIREELAAKKTLKAAIAAGYKRAFIVIFDSNFTTIMTAIILMYLGSGPVRGFAVTLTIGLLANLFTAVFVSRVVFDWLVTKGWMKSFKILQLVPHTNINFMRVRKLAFVASWALIIAGLGMFIHRGGAKVGVGEIYGIDFTGGDVVTLTFAEKIESSRVRQSLEASKVPDSLIQYQRGLGDDNEVLTLRLPVETGAAVVARLQQDFPAANFHQISKESVGAVVGHELLTQGLLAVGIALLGIMAYIAFRFGEWAYGVGALVALLHDVLMAIGLFCLTGRTFSLPVVAAILTIIGYTINEAIIIFDRIRENKKLLGGRINYHDLINRSVNETLPRTLLTGGTTLLTTTALFVFGGRVINDFAFMFMVGVLTGTYSSVYIAGSIVLWWHRDESKAARSSVAKPTAAKA